MKAGKQRPPPPAPTDTTQSILKALALLALLEWKPEGVEEK